MKATFGAGCFWKPQDEFDKIDGVKATDVGFMGGDKENPTYQEVCTDTTGHVEVVEVEFDPSKVKYEELLEIFWKIHDPTQLNKQGPDVGTQYRSVIFYHNEEQKKIAKKSLKEKQELMNNKVVTYIKPASEFYEAEEYHQKYVKKNKLFGFF